jgi:hypothetical protein
MTPRQSGRSLVALAGACWLAGCQPTVANQPPPQSPTSTSTSTPTPADGGLPALPLERKGVVVPSDVKSPPAPAPSDSPVQKPASPGAS